MFSMTSISKFESKCFDANFEKRINCCFTDNSFSWKTLVWSNTQPSLIQCFYRNTKTMLYKICIFNYNKDFTYYIPSTITTHSVSSVP